LKVKLAKTAGFCMGVRRAMELVLTEANRGKDPLFTFGPLIHNHQVLDLLASKGVISVDNLSGLKTGTIVIRAHGIPPHDRKAIKKTGLKIIDATCPKVARVQALIRYHTKKGSTAIIVGDEDHPEVRGLVGYSESPVYVIQDVEEVRILPDLDQVFVVAQTTQNEQNYREIVTALQDRFPSLQVFHTICEATFHRQQEVRSFAGLVDAIVVVGGFHSGNTLRLAQISKEANLPTFHVETEKNLDKERLSGVKIIGVTAGASTPKWMIKNVVSEIEGIRGRKDNAVSHCFKSGFKFLLANNIGVSIGAFCYAYAIAVFSERTPGLTFPLLTFLYIYAMHVLNRFLDKGASAYNDPERAIFLKKHRRLLILSGIFAVATALIISYLIGITTLIALCGLNLLGIAYSLPLLPESIRHKYSYYKIKDIPGSRSLSESLAWVAVIAVLPLLEMNSIYWPSAIISVLIVFSMSYVRSTLFDIFDVQGDLIVGTETLPITIGVKKTLSLLKIILVVTGVVLAVSPILGLVGPFSYLIFLSVFSLFLCLLACESRWVHPGITLEAMVEGNFLLTGLLALIWQAL